MQLKKAVVVDMFGHIERIQKPGEIMIQGAKGFFFLRNEAKRLWVAEYFGFQGLKNQELHLTKAHAIQACKEKLN